MNNSKWTIRSAIGDDLAFIYSTWERSYRYDSYLGKNCKNSIFFPYYARVIDWILSQSDTQVLLAVLPDEPNVILGYAVLQPNTLHYAFTKEAFQRMGIAKSIIGHFGQVQYFTHKTQSVVPCLARHPELTFNPFLLFKHYEGDLNGQNEKND